MMTRHPVPPEIDFRYPTPGMPVRNEKPLVPKEPNFVLTLGVIPDLLMFTPRPLPRLIRLLNLNPMANILSGKALNQSIQRP